MAITQYFRKPSSLGEERGSGHVHTKPPSEKLSSSVGRGNGWWSWSYSLLFWNREGVVVIVIHSLRPSSCPPPLAKGRVVVMITHSLPLRSCTPLLGKGRDGGHGHTESSFQKLSSSDGKGKGWWSLSYSLLFWEREEVVVIVIKGLLLKSSPFLGKGRHGHTEPSFQKLSSSAGKGKGWWSWSYSFLSWKGEGGNGHGHTQPSSKKLYSSSWTI